MKLFSFKRMFASLCVPDKYLYMSLCVCVCVCCVCVCVRMCVGLLGCAGACGDFIAQRNSSPDKLRLEKLKEKETKTKLT